MVSLLLHRQNLAYEVQPEKSIQNCYSTLPVDCYREWLLSCLLQGEIMGIVHMKELRYKSYEEDRIPICHSFFGPNVEL
ncbi:Bloom syndrome protein -like protein [Caligus rogercresseyi]|uniref:Bloom syndrome protein -like protein n=1 Tax=Caligus rogercresseyi TaxID=217165 RepID=A0A7T8HEI2_CALRO|nr:Bloom syndrome protein -like protein [Caligus rogercresseyi]